jgi:phenylpropionate dioxygenase-like ring-hydroxylating dioxygenase large terminal subunit
MSVELCSHPVIRNSWHPVARTLDVAGGAHAVRLLSTDVVLFRGADGTVTALPDRCSHRESPLSPGAVDDGCIVCPYHGWTFDQTGRCVRVPSAADGVPVPPKAHLTPYHCTERYGLVWVCLGEPRAPIPDMRWEDDPSFRRINTPVDTWKVATTRVVDNFLDFTHFPFVHTRTFGRSQDTQAPRIELQHLDDFFYGYRYEVLANNQSVGTIASGQDTEVVHRVMTTGFSLPFICRSTIEYDSGLEHILFLLSTPVDEFTSYFTFVVWRNDDFSVATDEVIQFDLAIGAEDKVMLERLHGSLPLDQTSLVNVAADKCSVEWRRQLSELLAAG